MEVTSLLRLKLIVTSHTDVCSQWVYTSSFPVSGFCLEPLCGCVCCRVSGTSAWRPEVRLRWCGSGWLLARGPDITLAGMAKSYGALFAQPRLVSYYEFCLNS